MTFLAAVTSGGVAMVISEDVLHEFQQMFPLWRGHANLSWKLQAEVFRRTGGKRYDEVTLLGYFMALAESRYARCPNWGAARIIETPG
jgi:hypothetical protein